MILSMTGFGRGTAVCNGREIAVELRSVNSRYFEYSSRIPRSCNYMDSRLKKQLNERVSRGKVELSMELTEYSRDILDQKQQILLDAAPAHPEITVTCFIPDRRKQGGAYGTLKGNLKKIDLSRRTMVMLDGTEISLDDVVDIQCDLFAGRV